MAFSTRIVAPDRTPSAVATLKVEFTEAEAFAAYHAISGAIADLDKEIARLSDIVYNSASHTSGERKAAGDIRAHRLAQRTALKCARIAMSDAGL
jgi:hypothetical protein